MTSRFSGTLCLLVVISVNLSFASSLPAKPIAGQERIPLPGNPADAEVLDIDTVAARVAQRLIKDGFKSVAVMDFHSDKGIDDHTLDVELAERFGAALIKASGEIHLVGRDRLVKALVDKGWMAIDVYDSNVFTTIAAVEGVQAVIGGKFQAVGDLAEISLSIKSVSKQKASREVKYKVQLPRQLQTSNEPVRDPLTGVYLSGFGGITNPQCKYCPQPEFSQEAREKRIESARSLLRITILADGSVGDLRFIKAAGFGLDQKSSDTIHNWRLSPGHLSDGTPVPCRTTVEVEFHRR